MKEDNHRTGFEIAIVGMSGRFPGANSLNEFWENLKNGVNSIRFFTEKELLEKSSIDPELIKQPNFVKAKGIIENVEYFDAFFFGYSPFEAEVLDPQVRIFSEICWETLEDAGCDPSTFNGPIGVYAGASASRSWEVLTVLTRKGETLGQFTADILSDKDYLSTRISYKLDLKGPSVTLFSACSTGLVAVDLACRALLTGQCDAALAGGVSVMSEYANAGGYIYNEGMINSPDGYVRAFDARAGGTVFSSGGGAVLLKRLDSAIADGDSIYAVIKGFAVNNDGLEKSGFTAPSVDGQAGVIQGALYMAEVEPESITYIETHGTATEIGDPIEIEALKTAFQTDKKQYCAIGSVKTNIGHLDVAAGIVGLLKVMLMFKNRQIPPSLYYEKPNPSIDFENSPFFVNTQLREWKSTGYPLRAGLSSFGVGGGNVHLVLEEWPGYEQSCDSPGEITFKSKDREENDYHLLLLSARTATALDKMTENLVTYLTQKPDASNCLADIAYTLKLGRKAFEHRKMLVCKDAPEAVSILQSSLAPDKGGEQHVQSHYTKDLKRAVFMFPGQGSQYVDMARGLYEKEPLFRSEIDHCFEILEPITGHDFKKILYPSLEENRSNGSYRTNIIDQTEITQPVIFTIEYALARLLMAWGIKPYAMIGHSIGEYTAACLSGVFSLTDALTVVAWRGKLMQQMPEGSMLSVSMPEKELLPLLTAELALAAVNGPNQCVVSGPHNAIETFARQLEEKGRQCRKLHTSHAYHSSMMDPILKTFEMKVAQVQRNQPRIPFISNVTGQWINNRDAMDPAYWARHLRGTVRFNDGLAELLKEKNALFIEVGPGRTLNTFIKQHPDKQPEHTLVNLVRHPNEELNDRFYLAEKIGQIWLYGLTVDWQAYYGEVKRHRLHLPTYPFQRQRYWIEGNPAAMIREGMQGKFAAGKKRNISDWFYIPFWKPSLVPLNESEKQEGKILLFLENENDFCLRLKDKFQQRDFDIIIVRAGAEFANQGKGEFIVNPSQPGDYLALFHALKQSGWPLRRIVHTWTISSASSEQSAIGTPSAPYNEEREIQYRGFYSLLYIAQAIKKQNFQAFNNDFKIIAVSSEMQAVAGEEIVYPEKSTLLGPLKVIPQELSEIICRSIDIVVPSPSFGSREAEKLSSLLLTEIMSNSEDTIVAYRNNRRWIQTFGPVKPDENEQLESLLREKGVYLITGGLGGIGLVAADYLAGSVGAKLILTGRAEFPGRDGWENWLSAHDKQDPISQKIRKIQEIERKGGEVMVCSVDIADVERMKETLGRAEERFGQLNGVIHAAGILGRKSNLCAVEEMSEIEAEEQFRPKVYGLLALAEVLKDKKVDFCLLTSSISSFLGGLGYAAYSAANIYMDAFVKEYNRKHGESWLSVNWDAWELGEQENRIIPKEESGVELAITAPEGQEVFRRIFSLGAMGKENQVVISTGDFQTRIDRWIDFKFLQEGGPSAKTAIVQHSRPDIATPFIAPQSQIEQKMAHIWEELLGIDRVGSNDDFFELGGDSLKATLLVAKIKQTFNTGITVREIFNSPRIRDLSKYIVKPEAEDISGIEITPLEAVEEKEFYPVSPAQKRFYILNEMEGISTAYNLPSFMEIEGKPDIPRLEKIFQLMIQRHESFRTSFVMKTGGPVQVVHKYVEPHIEYIESNENQKNEAVQQFIRPFDMSKPPLIRVGVIKMTEEKYILALDIHHIISDGTSSLLLVRDLDAYYNGKPLPEIKISYKDFSEWQTKALRSGRLKIQKEYWLNCLKGEIPTLNIQTDFPRPPVQNFEGERINFALDEVLTRELSQLMKETVTTLYMVLLAALYVLLSKYSGQEDIIVGSPAAAREQVELENIIGLFINSLPIRNYPIANKIFSEFLNEVKDSTINAYDNQGYPFGELLEELGVTLGINRNPLFDVELIIQNMEVAGLEMEKGMMVADRYDAKGAQLDISLEATEGKEEIQLALIYCTKLYKRETMDRFIRHYINCIRKVVKNQAVKLAETEIMDEEEKRQLLVDFNSTRMEYSREKTITQLFEEQAARTPDRIAVFGHGLTRTTTDEDAFISITYRELNDQSARLAGLLIEKGVLADHIVGIMVDRSIDTIVGILGIMKAGGAYLPIDPEYPQERIAYILKDSGVRILINKSEIRNPKLETNSNVQKINVQNKNFEDLLVLDFEHLNFDIVSNFDIRASDLNPSNLAYSIYTSGSTGKPKGVMVEHRNLTAYVNAFFKEFDLSTSDTSIQLASYAFDAFVEEVFPVLLRGGKLVIPSQSEIMDVYASAGLIVKHYVNIIDCSPLLLNEFDKLGIFASGDYKTNYIFISGGDVLKKEYIVNLLKVGKVYNTYGPTESTICATYYHYTGGDLASIPIGKPVSNYRIYILDKHGHLVSLGVVGEICVSGPGIARGYLNNPELTAEKFNRSNRFDKTHILYKTGDLARWLSDGNVEFLGRVDFQVKIRGFRIELEEIERQLVAHKDIEEAVVLANEDKSGNKYLCAYIIPIGDRKDEPFSIADLKDYLFGQLPDYMIPSHFIQIAEIPLTANGKVDKKALLTFETGEMVGAEYVPPANEVERKLVEMWSEILKKDRVGIHDNFFDLGGQSLKAMRLMAMIKETFGVKIPLIIFFQVGTVKGIGELISRGRDMEDQSLSSLKFEKKKRREREA